MGTLLKKITSKNWSELREKNKKRLTLKLHWTGLCKTGKSPSFGHKIKMQVMPQHKQAAQATEARAIGQSWGHEKVSINEMVSCAS